MEVFPARLGTRERLITYAVGYGVGIGVPLVLGVGFAVGFREPRLLLFPLPFAIAFGLPYFLRPTGFGVTRDEISILRRVGAKRIALREIRQVVSPAADPEGPVIGIARVEGIHGSFGVYWNRGWGRYRAYVTDARKKVELRLSNASRVIISPDDPVAFLRAVRRAAEESGAPVAVDGA